MARVAVTGHRGLSATVGEFVTDGIKSHLALVGDPLVGLTCLADGTDQIFASCVLAVHGRLEVIVPAQEYPDGLSVAYETLLGKAEKIVRLAHVESTDEAYLDASRVMLETADELVAVWDGKPARGHGGTAEVVELARTKGIPVTVIWPDGVSRD
jgi:hypothetical protein